MTTTMPFVGLGWKVAEADVPRLFLADGVAPPEKRTKRPMSISTITTMRIRMLVSLGVRPRAKRTLVRKIRIASRILTSQTGRSLMSTFFLLEGNKCSSDIKELGRG